MNDDDPDLHKFDLSDSKDPLSKDNQRQSLNSQTINPFASPSAAVEMASAEPQRPNFFDWFFAIFLASIAAVTVFPTTCVGGVMVLAFANSFDFVVAPQFATILIFSLMAICIGLAVAAAIWIARWYIKSVQQSQAKKMARSAVEISVASDATEDA